MQEGATRCHIQVARQRVAERLKLRCLAKLLRIDNQQIVVPEVFCQQSRHRVHIAVKRKRRAAGTDHYEEVIIEHTVGNQRKVAPIIEVAILSASLYLLLIDNPAYERNGIGVRKEDNAAADASRQISHTNHPSGKSGLKLGFRRCHHHNARDGVYGNITPRDYHHLIKLLDELLNLSAKIAIHHSELLVHTHHHIGDVALIHGVHNSCHRVQVVPLNGGHLHVHGSCRLSGEFQGILPYRYRVGRIIVAHMQGENRLIGSLSLHHQSKVNQTCSRHRVAHRN